MDSLRKLQEIRTQKTLEEAPAQKSAGQAAPVMPSETADPALIESTQPAGPDATLDSLLRLMVTKGASDMHIKVGSVPVMRVDGKLRPTSYAVMTEETMQLIFDHILKEEQRAIFARDKDLDLAITVPGAARFRVNLHQQMETAGMAIRLIPEEPRTMDQLGLSPILKEMIMKPRGLILVTGPTGSGKTTTLAAMINHINENRQCHIVTVEDPIEFIHKDKKSFIMQREVGRDTRSFSKALIQVLRQDPDVILIGEMRDLETTAIAITAAETGHLVLATLHTSSASATMDRIIDIFPPHQHQQIRMQLSITLEGVICQTLVPRAGGSGRVLAMEILHATTAVRNIIRDGKTFMIPNIIQAGSEYGMQSFDSSLCHLYKRGLITHETAVSVALSIEEFESLAR